MTDRFSVSLRVTPAAGNREDASTPSPNTRRERENEVIEFERWDGMS